MQQDSAPKTVTLGEVIQYKQNLFRVVRIISRSISLFQPIEGDPYVREESYIELRDVNGAVEFIELTSERRPYTGTYSPIKGLDEV